jgi:hypothetical protein
VLEKNSVEKLWVQISHYKGSTFLDVRVYFQDDEGEWKPTKKGITVKKDAVAPLLELLKKVEKEL